MSEERQLGTPEEIAQAKKHLADVHEHNSAAVIHLLTLVRERVVEDKASLEALSDATPHLFTRFLMIQAASALSLVDGLLAAAVELTPTDEDSSIDDGGNVGQYL